MAASGGLVVYLGFNSGGFFPGAVGFTAGLVAAGLVLRLTLAQRPLSGLGTSVGVVAGALALLAATILVSSTWSHAPARAVIEFDRTLLYLLVFLLFGLVGRSDARVGAVILGVGAGAAGICGAGFASRTLPDVFPTAMNLAEARLSHPVDYWNALGIMAAIGLVLAVHVASDPRWHRIVRAAGASLTPLLCATLLLTFSRGAIVAAVVGILVYAGLARGRGTATSLIAVTGPSALAIVAAYRADRLATEDFRAPAAVAQGHDLALLTLGCCVAAGLLFLLLVRVEPRLARVGTAIRRARFAAIAALVLALGVMVASGVAGDARSALSRQYDNFLKASVTVEGAERERLAQVSNNGRLDFWRAAIDGFERAPLAGNGAGTYALIWAQDRPTEYEVADGHSLVLELAAELGVLGVALLALTLVTMLGALARRAWTGPPGYAAAAAVSVVWLLHAGIDWGWEMPVVTAPVLALAGISMGRPADAEVGRLNRLPRVLASLACLLAAVTPLSMARSQERLNESVRAFRAGDCRRSIDAALSSNRAMPVRPEAFQMMSFCDSRLGLDELAVSQGEKAVRLDPESWEFRYSLALVRGAAGKDPSAALRDARRLNPRSVLVRRARRTLGTADPGERRRRARRAPLPFQQ